jgi:hypothetical protein
MRADFDPEYLMGARRSPRHSRDTASPGLTRLKASGSDKNSTRTTRSDGEMRDGFDAGPIRRVRQVVGYLAASCRDKKKAFKTTVLIFLAFMGSESGNRR